MEECMPIEESPYIAQMEDKALEENCGNNPENKDKPPDNSNTIRVLIQNSRYQQSRQLISTDTAEQKKKKKKRK